MVMLAKFLKANRNTLPFKKSISAFEKVEFGIGFTNQLESTEV